MNSCELDSQDEIEKGPHRGEVYFQLKQKIKSSEDSILDALDYRSLRNSLPPEAREWRLFNTAENAVACAWSLSYFGVLPFSYLHGSSLRRYYLVTHPLELWHRTLNRPTNRTFEIIPETRPCKLYTVLEFDKTLNPDRDGEKMAETYLKILRSTLSNSYSIATDPKNILTLDASTPTKFHHKIIFQSPLTFKTPSEVDHLIKKTCNDILDVVDGKTDLAETWEVTRSNVERLTVIDPRQNSTLCIKQDIYTKNYFSLTYNSCDWDSFQCLKSAENNKYQVPVTLECLRQEYLFLASLVTFAVPLGVVVKEPPEVLYEEKQVEVEAPKSLPIKSVISPYPSLDTFMSNMMRPCSVDVVLQYTDTSTLVYATKEAGFCENVGRFHNRNRVMYVVSEKRGVWFQKCHDPDCKEFKSESKPLPLPVQWEMGVEADPWDVVIGEQCKDLPNITKGTKSKGQPRGRNEKDKNTEPMDIKIEPPDTP